MPRPMPTNPSQLDPIDRRLLDTIQQAVPLQPRPFAALADQLDMDESDVLTRLRRIRDEGLISRIAAIFDTRSLGYESVLVAARYAPETIDAAAEVINRHPGVSHNYARTADYNLWYTLAVPPDSRLGLEGTAARLSRESGALAYRLLPSLRVYKIGVRLPLTENQVDSETDRSSGTTARRLAPAEPGEPAGNVATPDTSAGPQIDPADAELQGPCRECRRPPEITPQVKRVILALQEDLPLEPEPFAIIAARHGLTADEVLAAAEDLRAAGTIRRYAAVLRHRRVGFAANCMTVWSVATDRADDVGRTLAGFEQVTHCYLRPAWPDWPYNLYAMIHCRTDAECGDLIERMKAAADIDQMLSVYSTKEYKKVRLQYFSPAFEQWERAHSG